MPRRGASLNHVILYVGDVEPSLRFYCDPLGFRVIEAMEGYARLRSLSRGAAIAPHVSRERRQPPKTRPIVLYFETPDLAGRCRTLRRRGVRFDQLPARMPWGWDHPYLRDPEGHPISLYWAGRKRVRKSPPMSES